MAQKDPCAMMSACFLCAKLSAGWQIDNLPTYVAKSLFVSHSNIEPKTWICLNCLTAKGDFVPPNVRANGKRGSVKLQCASQQYTCTKVSRADRGKPLVSAPPAIDANGVRSILQIPPYANVENAICKGCRQILYAFLREFKTEVPPAQPTEPDSPTQLDQQPDLLSTNESDQDLSMNEADQDFLNTNEADQDSLSMNESDRDFLNTNEAAGTPPMATSSRCECPAANLLRQRWNDDNFQKTLFHNITPHYGMKRGLAECLELDEVDARQLYRLKNVETPMKKRRTSMCQRTWQGQSLTEVMREFWVDNAHPCPTQSKLVRKIDGVRVEEYKSFVLTPLADVYKEFKDAFAGQINPIPSASSFDRTRPFWVKGCPDSARTRCRYFTELVLQLRAFLRWRKRFHPNCSICAGVPSSVKLMREMSQAEVNLVFSCLDTGDEQEGNDTPPRADTPPRQDYCPPRSYRDAGKMTKGNARIFFIRTRGARKMVQEKNSGGLPPQGTDIFQRG